MYIRGRMYPLKQFAIASFLTLLNYPFCNIFRTTKWSDTSFSTLAIWHENANTVEHFSSGCFAWHKVASLAGCNLHSSKASCPTKIYQLLIILLRKMPIHSSCRPRTNHGTSQSWRCWAEIGCRLIIHFRNRTGILFQCKATTIFHAVLQIGIHMGPAILYGFTTILFFAKNHKADI